MTVPAPSRYDAVLLVGFGGPEGPDDVMPFLRNVTRGRGVPQERLEQVAGHYLALGGVSPINTHNRALVAALGAQLRGRGIGVPVLWGNRNWAPYLADTLAGAHAAGHRRLLAVLTSAYASYSSCRQYREDLAGALQRADLVGRMVIDKVRPYVDTVGFVEPFAAGLTEALGRARAAGLTDEDLCVVFTTHSVPDVMADASGGPGDGRLYVRQHEAVCVAVMDRAGLGRADPDPADVDRADPDRPGPDQPGPDQPGPDRAGPTWRLAYQSRSGSPQVPWLGPDILEVIDELATHGHRGVVIVPIGFISDHVEVIWDLDREAVDAARAHGMWVARVATPGTHPAFVSGLADLVAARLGAQGEAAGTIGNGASWCAPPLRRPDTCPPGCCRPTRVRPTVAGDDSIEDWAGSGVATAALAASGIGTERG